MRFFVLGGYGIIGKVVVSDLASFSKHSEIIVAGRDFEKAQKYAKSFKSPRLKAVKADINDKNSLARLIKKSDADVVVNCVQYYFNYQIMEACIKAKTNYVDLGGLYHMTKKQLKLNEKFRKIGKTAVLGCGSSPGITNILAAYGSKFLKNIISVEIFFADKDKTKYNQDFVLPYSFKTIVDEYTLKPAVLSNGKIRFAKPLSGIREYSIEGYGKKQGFLTLHSELATLPEFLKNKGIRKMEFRVTFDKRFNEKIKTLVNLGFASEEDINTTSSIMDHFVIKPGTKVIDEETLRVVFNSGSITMDAVTKSRFNIPAGTYDTGVPCSIIAQMISKKMINEKGVYAPEKVINPGIFFRELRRRGIFILKNGKKID